MKVKRLIALGVRPETAGLLVALVLGCVLATDPFRIVTLVRERGFDLLYSVVPRQTTSTHVLVVDIDDATLARLGSWPVPRIELAHLIDRLAGARPSAVAFDIFFPRADRHSPRTLATELSTLPGGAAVQPLIAGMPDADARFAEALRNVPSVIGSLAATDSNVPPLNFIEIVGHLDPALAAHIDGIQGPYPFLADAALGIGIQSLWGEDDGLVRRVPLIFDSNGSTVPGLALEAARIGLSAPFIQVDGAHGAVRFGTRGMRLEPGGTMRIHWSAPAHWRARTISALDVLDDKVPTARLAGAFILIGSSSPEVGALRPTAASAFAPSVQIEAEALEQLVDGQAPFRPVWAEKMDIGGALALGLIATLLATLRGPIFGAATVFGLMTSWVLTVITVFRLSDVLIDPVLPPLVALLCSGAAATAAFARTRRIKALISSRFEQYLAPDVVRAIVAQPDRLKLAGEMREVTALFTDIEGFTALTSRVEPQRLIKLLDGYFTGVCRIVTQHGGMIDLIVGDAVHAFFNMPVDIPDHADAAVECALAIVVFSNAFQQSPEVSDSAFGRTRIGIETGPAIVGDVGGPDRFNYTAHGRVANSAARLEAANKELGTTICVGPGTAAKAGRTSLRRVGTLQLRGFADPVEVYTPSEIS